MSRTFFSLRRKRGFYSRHPAPCHHGRRWSGVVPLSLCDSISSVSFAGRDDADQFRNEIKPCGCTVSTMDLSEARGLVLFRVIRGGIGITQRLGTLGTVYRPLSYSPSNPSVSRTDWPPPETITGDGRGSSPETLKRLAISVFRRRSSLPSSKASALWLQSCAPA
jgi:hypothetical protein